MEKEHSEREHLKSRLGFIFISAGCAIGIGNVWKFPYMVGQNGGGAFVLIYLICLLALGLPVLTMEFAIGRASQKSPAAMYRALNKPKWRLHGYMAMAGNYLLMMFYSTVAGWMLEYFVLTVKGDFINKTPQQVTDMFGTIMSNPVSMVFYMGIVVVLGFFICSVGVQKGLERVTKFMMPALLIIMIILTFNSVSLEGAAEGLKFYIFPDFAKIAELGMANVIYAAMNQAFFTLSLGLGSMAVFGSYIGKDRALAGESVNVVLLDTFVAVVSGLIIFPACFAFGVEPDSGPNLIFITLPNIFNNMPMSRLWGSLFFAFMTFAAFSTVLAVFENIISCCEDVFGWSRKKTCFINCIAIFVLSLPCALGFNVLSEITPFGTGSTIMDLEDFIVSYLMLPIGSLAFIFFCTLRYGWGWEKYLAEVNTGKGLKIPKWLRGYCTFVLPVIVALIMLLGLYFFFV